MTPVNKFLSYKILPVGRAIQPPVFPSFRQEFGNRVCEKLRAPAGVNAETGFSTIKRSCELDATRAPVGRRNSSLRENSFRFWLYVQVYLLLFCLLVSQREYLMPRWRSLYAPVRFPRWKKRRAVRQTTGVVRATINSRRNVTKGRASNRRETIATRKHFATGNTGPTVAKKQQPARSRFTQWGVVSIYGGSVAETCRWQRANDKGRHLSTVRASFCINDAVPTVIESLCTPAQRRQVIKSRDIN